MACQNKSTLNTETHHQAKKLPKVRSIRHEDVTIYSVTIMYSKLTFMTSKQSILLLVLVHSMREFVLK